ncbi:CLUMA_CG002866, isoform A [Clunio marinus]|uniref:CLUMA_CG002866, isoform A n=1 Tax=Clunio marinus TaxID=568069 RepID=A0A1J1HLC8_9DIPT|nr:CLUMA_CG002866, isoform A [Clunio marinus]
MKSRYFKCDEFSAYNTSKRGKMFESVRESMELCVIQSKHRWASTNTINKETVKKTATNKKKNILKSV